MLLLERRDIMFIRTMTKADVRNTLFENEKMSVFSLTKGKRKKEKTTVKTKKNLIMK